MGKFHQGFFEPKNKDKYLGKKTPIYRSGWELRMMQMCDTHPNILGWASESHRIPYRHPLTGKATTYVPDFLIIYEDANGQKHAEIIEVKPSKQMMGNARSAKDKMAAVVNDAKWKVAKQWAQQQGMGFRIITENEIFRSPNKKSNKKRRRR